MWPQLSHWRESCPTSPYREVALLALSSLIFTPYRWALSPFLVQLHLLTATNAHTHKQALHTWQPYCTSFCCNLRHIQTGICSCTTPPYCHSLQHAPKIGCCLERHPSWWVLHYWVTTCHLCNTLALGHIPTQPTRQSPDFMLCCFKVPT